MSKEVKRYDPLLGLARNAKLRRMDMQCDPQWVLDLAAERDALLAERDAARMRVKELEGRMDYAAETLTRTALQGEQL